MGRQQLLFILLGFFLVGIAMLTEYLSINNTPTWAAVNNRVPCKIEKLVLISSRNDNLAPLLVQVNYVSSISNYHSPVANDQNVFVGNNGSSALLHHIYEISPVSHKSISAMVGQSSMQFK